MQLRPVLNKIMSGQVMSLAFFTSVLHCRCVEFIAYAKKSHLVISADSRSLATEQILRWLWLLAVFWLLWDASATAFLKSCSRSFTISPDLCLSCSKFITSKSGSELRAVNSFRKSLNSKWVGMKSIQCSIKLNFNEGAKNGGTAVHTGKFNLRPCNQFSADNIKIGVAYRKQCIAWAGLDPHSLLRYHQCSNSLAIVARREKRKITTQLWFAQVTWANYTVTKQ